MIDQRHFRHYVVRPTLGLLGLQAGSAEDLIMGTAAVESHMGTYLKQVGGGPALGVMQMEPETHDDIWRTWLAYRANDARLVKTLVGDHWVDVVTRIPKAHLLITDLAYSVAMARHKYRRAAPPLPLVGDWEALGEYWVTHYNAGGAGTVEKWMDACRECEVIT